jgi:hypothetical protein
MADVFTVPESLAGQTVSDITKKFGGDVGILSKILGMGGGSQLQSGQVIRPQSVPGINPAGSTEFQLLSKIFSPTSEQNLAQQAQQKAIAPAVESLREGIPLAEQAGQVRGETLTKESQSLQDRYQQIIGEIKGREERAVGRTETAGAREFGARGLVAAGPGFEAFQAQRTGDLTQQFGELLSSTGFGFEGLLRDIGAEQAQLPVETAQNVQGIRNAIAQLQAGAGQQGIQDALNMLQLQQQQSQFETSEERLNRALGLEERALEFQTPESLQAVKSGSQLFAFNPLTGEFQPGPTGGGGGGGSALRDILFGEGTPGFSTQRGETFIIDGEEFEILS